MKGIFNLPPSCLVKTERPVNFKFIVKLTEISTNSSDFYVTRLATTIEMRESSYF
jgi:hypothetical protein